MNDSEETDLNGYSEVCFAYHDLFNTVVRCRDCMHATGIPEQMVCKMPCGDATAGLAWVEPDGFCAWGERKTK